jgi:hypothetical protein
MEPAERTMYKRNDNEIEPAAERTMYKEMYDALCSNKIGTRGYTHTFKVQARLCAKG